MIEITHFIYLFILTILGLYSGFSLSKGNKIVKFYAILTLVVEMFSYIYLHIFSKATAVGYNFYSIIEIALWLLYIKSMLKISLNYIFTYWVFYVIIFLQLGHFKMDYTNTNGFILNNSIIVCCISLYFFSILKKGLFLNGNFWIMAGALFYNLGGFVITGMIIIMANKDAKLASSLFRINIFLNIIYYSFFLYGVYKLNKKEPESSF